MKPYSEYTAEELAMERLFIRWVRNPDDPSIGKFWTHWLEQHPHRTNTLAEARQLVETVSDWPEPNLSGHEVASLWRQVRASVDWLPNLEQLDPKAWKPGRWSVGIAATVILVVLWFLWLPYLFLPDRTGSGILKADSAKVRAQRDTTKENTQFKLK